MRPCARTANGAPPLPVHVRVLYDRLADVGVENRPLQVERYVGKYAFARECDTEIREMIRAAFHHFQSPSAGHVQEPAVIELVLGGGRGRPCHCLDGQGLLAFLPENVSPLTEVEG